MINLSKKQIAFVLLLILFSSFILAQDGTPELSDGSEVEKIQESIDEYVPIDDEGQFDPSKYKSRAEERIDKINKWIEENASWLKLVFGMVPEVSWLFAFVLYFWLFFFVLFVLNAEIFMFFNYMFAASDTQSAQAKKYARVVGIAGFVVLAVLKIIYNIGRFFYAQWSVVWNYLLPLGLIAVVIGIIILLVIALFCPAIILKFLLWSKMRKEKKAKEQTDEDRKIIHKFTEHLTKRT